MTLQKGDKGNNGHPIFRVRGLPGVYWRKDVLALRRMTTRAARRMKNG